MGIIVDLANNINFDEIVRTKGLNYKPDFQIFTAGIESDRSKKNRVNMIGSSTQEDMQGDTMSLLALNDMTKAASNLTIWLNHDYSLPDSIFGSIAETPTIMHQDGIADLHLSVDVEMDNPAAARVKQYIDKGRRLGCSIGCMVTKYEVPSEEDGEDWQSKGIIVHGVYVVEYSVVGIPANQRSWVENAIRGVFTRTLDPHLAPAMKALWPTSYKDAVKELPTERRKTLDAMPAREKPEYRLNWHAASKSYSLNHNGDTKTLSPDQVKSLFRGEDVGESNVLIESVLDEEIPSEVADMSKSEEDLTTKEAPDRHEHVDGTQSLPESDEIEVSNPEVQNDEPAPELPGEEIKCDEETPELTKAETFELPDHVKTLLSSYNALGMALGFPEITPSMYTAAQHPALQKDTGDLTSDQHSQCKMIHDMICSMTKGAVCTNDASSVQEAADNAAVASGNQPVVSVSNYLDVELLSKFEVLSKSIDAHHAATIEHATLKGDIDFTRKELEKARDEISTLSAEIIATKNTILSLKNMPLGNPIQHNRTTHVEDSIATFKDLTGIVGSQKEENHLLAVDSLKDAMALTRIVTESMQNGQYVKYREWPAGVGGTVEKGVRPPLTGNQFQYMDFSDIQAYRAGEQAKVPCIDNQV